MPSLSPETKKLIQEYKKWHNSLKPKEKVGVIHADEVAGKVAAFYEKIRGIIDWKEEHLLKRGAIERILKRKLLVESEIISQEKDNKKLAESLVLELIRGGYFPNDTIEISKINEVQSALKKYIFILKNLPRQQNKSKLEFYGWIISIAACEIEEILSPALKEMALINYMTNLMKQRIKLDPVLSKKISEKEKNTLIFIAVCQALFNLDSPIIYYHLLKIQYPDWKNLPKEKLIKFSQDIQKIYSDFERLINHPFADKFYQICKKYNTPYIILNDILSKEEPEIIEKKIENPEFLEKSIKNAYMKRLSTLKARLTRAAFYSTLSIFITNVASLLAVEIPLTKYITGHFNFLAIAVDVLGPTFLMAFLVVTIPPPKKENLNVVIVETMKIVYESKKKDIYEIKFFPKKGLILNAIIGFFYFLTFIAVISIIVFFLYKINFPPLSYIIFIIFFSLIAFAGTKIREKVKELEMIEEKETFIQFILDPFAIPIIQLGKWLTTKWKKYNLISVFFSAIIDMPFSIFVEFIEQWRYFLKEKKEKLH